MGDSERVRSNVFEKLADGELAGLRLRVLVVLCETLEDRVLSDVPENVHVNECE